MNDLLQSVSQTSLSQTLQTVAWAVPLIQSIHIMALGVVFASAAVLDLRLLGAMGRDQTLARLSRRFAPGVGWGLLVLLATGLLLMIAEPTRALLNPFFQLKMALLVAAGAMTWAIAAGAERDAGLFAGIEGRAAAKPVALLSLILWLAIIAFGRWIAYGP